MRVYLFLALLFVSAIVTFIFQNNTQVAVHFLNWVSPSVPLAIVVLIAACGGALITFLLDSVRYFKIAKRIKELGTQNNKLQDELDKLKKKSKITGENGKKAETKEADGTTQQ